MQQVPGAVFAELMAINDEPQGLAALELRHRHPALGAASCSASAPRRRRAWCRPTTAAPAHRAILSAPAGDYNFIGYHPTTPTAVVAGGRRSTDGGASFPTGSAYVAQGLSAGGALYARSGNNAIMRSTNWASGTPTWTPFYTSAPRSGSSASTAT